MPEKSCSKITPFVPPLSRKKPPAPVPAYTELQVTTNFSLLHGASHPEEYVLKAYELGYRAIGITDHNTLAGVVRGHLAARELEFTYLVGCRLELFPDPAAPAGDSIEVLVYPRDREAYSRLCELLTLGQRRAEKGSCRLYLDDYLNRQKDFIAILIPPLDVHASARRRENFRGAALKIRGAASDPNELSVAIAKDYDNHRATRLETVLSLAREAEIAPVAVNDVYYHIPERRVLQDVLTCIRHTCTLSEAGFRLFQNAERHLKPPAEIARLFQDLPQAVRRTQVLTEMAAQFSLAQLKYEYPAETCPAGLTPLEHLSALAWEGARDRYPQGVPARVQDLIRRELTLIGELKYEKYFLTCHDIVRFARSRGILCQGRGSAANSAVCYCARHHGGKPRYRIDFSSNVSSARKATSRRTSTSTSSTSGGKR
jgi:error-prone DNA polymerase